MLESLGERTCAATAKILYREGEDLLLELNHLSHLHQDRKKSGGCVQPVCDGRDFRGRWEPLAIFSVP